MKIPATTRSVEKMPAQTTSSAYLFSGLYDTTAVHAKILQFYPKNAVSKIDVI
jgi:hypothetical protein